MAKKTFRTHKVLFEVLASTIYSPRIESVTVMFFTQIRFYRVYIDDDMYSLNRQNTFEKTNLNSLYIEFVTATVLTQRCLIKYNSISKSHYSLILKQGAVLFNTLLIVV